MARLIYASIGFSLSVVFINLLLATCKLCIIAIKQKFVQYAVNQKEVKTKKNPKGRQRLPEKPLLTF